MGNYMSPTTSYDVKKVVLSAQTGPMRNAREYLSRFYPRQSVTDLANPVFWRDVLVEFILCTYVECCVIWVITTLNADMYTPSTTHLGLFVGLFIYALLEGYGPFSGAVINPAVAWGFFLAGRISAARLWIYSGVEMAGAASGAMIGYFLTPSNKNVTIPTLMPSPELSATQAMSIEAILTFNLLFVALSVTNSETKMTFTSRLPIALCLGTGLLAAGTHTGGMHCPNVPFGPALINNNWKNHWVYWAGPYIGATVGSAVYTFSTFVKDHFVREKGDSCTELSSSAQGAVTKF